MVNGPTNRQDQTVDNNQEQTTTQQQDVDSPKSGVETPSGGNGSDGGGGGGGGGGTGFGVGDGGGGDGGRQRKQKQEKPARPAKGGQQQDGTEQQQTTTQTGPGQVGVAQATGRDRTGTGLGGDVRPDEPPRPTAVRRLQDERGRSRGFRGERQEDPETGRERKIEQQVIEQNEAVQNPEEVRVTITEGGDVQVELTEIGRKRIRGRRKTQLRDEIIQENPQIESREDFVLNITEEGEVQVELTEAGRERLGEEFEEEAEIAAPAGTELLGRTEGGRQTTFFNPAAPRAEDTPIEQQGDVQTGTFIDEQERTTEFIQARQQQEEQELRQSLAGQLGLDPEDVDLEDVTVVPERARNVPGVEPGVRIGGETELRAVRQQVLEESPELEAEDITVGREDGDVVVRGGEEQVGDVALEAQIPTPVLAEAGLVENRITSFDVEPALEAGAEAFTTQIAEPAGDVAGEFFGSDVLNPGGAVLDRVTEATLESDPGFKPTDIQRFSVQEGLQVFNLPQVALTAKEATETAGFVTGRTIRGREREIATDIARPDPSVPEVGAGPRALASAEVDREAEQVSIRGVDIESDQTGGPAPDVEGLPLREREQETVDIIADVGEERAVRVGEFAAENPARIAGGVLGSLAISSGGIAVASRVGGVAGRATAFAVQPGEELAIAAARRGLVSPRTATAVPGVRRGQIGGTQTAGAGRVRVSRERVRDLPPERPRLLDPEAVDIAKGKRLPDVRLARTRQRLQGIRSRIAETQLRGRFRGDRESETETETATERGGDGDPPLFGRIDEVLPENLRRPLSRPRTETKRRTALAERPESATQGRFVMGERGQAQLTGLSRTRRVSAETEVEPEVDVTEFTDFSEFEAEPAGTFEGEPRAFRTTEEPDVVSPFERVEADVDRETGGALGGIFGLTRTTEPELAPFDEPTIGTEPRGAIEQLGVPGEPLTRLDVFGGTRDRTRTRLFEDIEEITSPDIGLDVDEDVTTRLREDIRKDIEQRPEVISRPETGEREDVRPRQETRQDTRQDTQQEQEPRLEPPTEVNTPLESQPEQRQEPPAEPRTEIPEEFRAEPPRETMLRQRETQDDDDDPDDLFGPGERQFTRFIGDVETLLFGGGSE